MARHKIHCGKAECPAAVRLRAALWLLKNPDRARATKRVYLDRPEVQEAARNRVRRWSAENKERKRAADKAYSLKNRARVTAYKAKYRASLRNAAPSWLTDNQWEEIAAIYASCPDGHEVDHIVPLQGKTVCGLHVPWNLRVLTRVDNNRRPRVWVAE